jgi:hypothetical protein
MEPISISGRESAFGGHSSTIIKALENKNLYFPLFLLSFVNNDLTIKS